jgi:hypothetical protein
MNYSINVVYNFDLSEKVQVGDIPKNELYELFTDGRVSSKFLERQISIWFPDLEFVDEDGYDHISKSSGIKWDVKGFTKGGATYAPSNMIGKGRKILIEEMHLHANTIGYIFTDIVDFPKIKVVFKDGKDLVTSYPDGRIKFSDRDIFFTTKT